MKKREEKITGQKNNPAKQKQEPKKPVYRSIKSIPQVQVKEFTYDEFKEIADKAPFTQAEWASFLHLSERTLQRYAKNNGSFAPINAERALQIEKVLKEGTAAFGSTEKFYKWLQQKPYMLEGGLSIESLTSYEGIQKVLTQLGRIQHGLFS